MAVSRKTSKKKAAPKPRTSKRTSASKKAPGTKVKRTEAKKTTAPKKSTKILRQKRVAKMQSAANRSTPKKRAAQRRSHEKSWMPPAVGSPPSELKAQEVESGDLQGLSDVESADSESVDELLEEGNAFEAEAVRGVEIADAADEREVRTHEVPEDDVPSEYSDKD